MILPNHSESDELKKIRERVESTPPDDFLKALEAEYEIALKELAAQLGQYPEELNEHSTNLVERLAKHFLFNYYTGFAIAKFTRPFAPLYRKQDLPTFRQRALEDAIQDLAQIEPARKLMVEWFEAALEGKLAQLLREWLGSAGSTINPKRSFYRSIAQPFLFFAAEAEKWNRYETDTDVFNILDFGLGGFYLIFKRTGVIRDSEFECLLKYLEHLANKRPSFFISIVVDVIRILAIPVLSPAQRAKLSSFVASLRDLENIPYKDIYEQIEDPIVRAETRLDSIGLSHPISWILKKLYRIMYPYEKNNPASEDKDQKKERAQIIRRLQVAEMVGILASQDEGLLFSFEDLISIPLHGADETAVNFAFAGVLPSFLRWPSSLKILARILKSRQQTAFSTLVVETLQETDISLSSDMAQRLIEIIREQGDSAQWVWQILENVSVLSEPAESWITTRVVQVETNPAVLRAIMRLHENLAQRQSVTDLEDALISRMINLVTTDDVSLDTQWINWLINLGRREPLRKLLETLIVSASKTLPARKPRYIETLRLIASQAERVKNIDAVTLAACWLVDPDDWIEDKRPLIEKIKESIAMLGASDTDENTQKRIVSIFEHAIPKEPLSITSDRLNEIARKEGYLAADYVQKHLMLAPIFAEPLHLFPESKREGADKRLAVAKALGKIHYPQLALSLLENLLQLALEMEQAWKSSRYTEFSYEARQIARETLKSIVMLKPLTTQAVLLIQDTLMASRAHESPLHSELTPAFIHEIIYLLAHEHEVSPKAVPVLIELVWRNHCGPLINDESLCVRRNEPAPLKALERPSFQLIIGEKIHRYLHIYDESYGAEGLILLCALQALANVTYLTFPQQQIIWRVYRSSWHALTKSLCLLILGRQRRPVRKETVRELIRVLRQDPTMAYGKTIIKYLFRSLLFRIFNKMSPPDPDLNYTYLCQTVAVSMVGTLLNQERHDPIVRKRHRTLEKALLATTSLFRYGMELQVDASMTTSGAKGMAQVMGATQSEEDKTTWMAHPADRAYQVLQDLITAGVFSSSQNLQSCWEKFKRVCLACD